MIELVVEILPGDHSGPAALPETRARTEADSPDLAELRDRMGKAETAIRRLAEAVLSGPATRPDRTDDPLDIPTSRASAIRRAAGLG